MLSPAASHIHQTVPLPSLLLQLVTAQRKGEILGAEWSEIDLEAGWWTIPEDKAKNGIQHRVPLSAHPHDRHGDFATDCQQDTEPC